jgi:hypothetical protein
VAVPVQSRDDFKTRMSDLAGLIEGFDVPDALLESDDRPNGSLNRLHAALRRAGVDGTEDAIAELRTVVKVRTALQHPGAAKELHSHFETLGISYPPADWSRAWDAIRARLIAAVATIRDELRRGASD